MKGRLSTAGKWWCTTQGAADKVCKHGGVRLFVLKASNQATVHGTKLPVPDMVDKEEVKMDIQKAKEEKEKRRKEIEETVDSQPKKKNLEPLSDSYPDLTTENRVILHEE